jgi:hypothetical protein
MTAANEDDNDSDDNNNTKNEKRVGDPIREATGIRPSLHPTTINAIAEALKMRSLQAIQQQKEQQQKGNESPSKKKKSKETKDATSTTISTNKGFGTTKTKPTKTTKKDDAEDDDSEVDDDDDDDDDDLMFFRASDTVEPLKVAITAGKIAADAISKRQASSKNDGMKLTIEEEQAVAGRIMGVIMRLDTLEEELYERVSSVSWIVDYDEWNNFGVLQDENNTSNDDDAGTAKPVEKRIIEDPLFCMNRAECLLGIFLQEVEIPKLQQLNETVPDDSKIDFLDADRYEVVIGS